MSVGLKICGVTRRVDLDACVRSGVEAVGINLWSGSRRGLSLPAARTLLVGCSRAGPRRVGVFVDPDPDFVREAATLLDLDLVQLHGDAPVAPYAAMQIPYVWVLRGTPSLEALVIPSPAPAWVLLDAAVEGYGGAGRATDWAWARRAVEYFAPLPVWLAGGIDPENAADALARVGPAGLDVASGAESPGATAGEKDAGKIATLAAICKNHGGP